MATINIVKTVKTIAVKNNSNKAKTPVDKQIKDIKNSIQQRENQIFLIEKEMLKPYEYSGKDEVMIHEYAFSQMFGLNESFSIGELNEALVNGCVAPSLVFFKPAYGNYIVKDVLFCQQYELREHEDKLEKFNKTIGEHKSAIGAAKAKLNKLNNITVNENGFPMYKEISTKSAAEQCCEHQEGFLKNLLPEYKPKVFMMGDMMTIILEEDLPRINVIDFGYPMHVLLRSTK